MKKYFYALCMATALGTVGCSDDEVPGELDNSMKTPIQFSMTDEGGSAITKAGFMTRAGFTDKTAIVMKMKSVHKDDATDVKYTVTKAEAGAETAKKYSEVTFANNASVINQRYWDDAHGRNSKLSIFAVAVPNQETASGQLKLKDVTTGAWFTETAEDLKIDWTVTKTGTTADQIKKEDLVYSNNIREGSSERGVVKWNFTTASYYDYDGDNFSTNPDLEAGTMQFRLKSASMSDGPGKFDTGHLNFKHALSRVTLNIKAADGFSTADYADGKVKEVHLNNVPYKGTFNVKDGTWAVTDADKGQVYLVKEETVESGYNLKYTGQIVPEYVIKKDDQSVNMLQFTINNNVYYVTDAMVHKALVGNTTNELDANENIVMKPGKNYVLNITVNKTKIENITATLADWLPVTGNHEQNNAYLKFENKFVEKGSACANFDLYRIPDNSSTPSTTPGEHEERNWYTGYTDTEARASLRQKGSTNVWEAIDWYFESNIHFYHFRTVKQGTTIKPGSAPDPKDYFEIQTGNDYHWGAPMDKDKNVPKYNVDKGYEDFIYYAIGATESTIKLQEFHMMSQVDIVLTTTTGLDKVSLYDKDTKTGTTVKITKIFKKGQVEMGRGLVTKTGDRSDYDVKTPDQTSEDTYYQTKPSEGAAKSKVYSSLVIPQALVEADVYVGLEIQTPDKNMYYVVQKLSEITAGVASPDDGYNHTNGDKIQRWYPGHHYTYTLTLKKTGIDKITCSLADWKKITGSSDVTLED